MRWIAPLIDFWSTTATKKKEEDVSKTKHLFATFEVPLNFTCGWDLEVPQDLANPLANLMDLTVNHGRFTMEHVRQFCVTYVNGQTLN